MAPEDLAARVFGALARRHHILIPGLGNLLLGSCGHVAPRLAEGAMKRAFFDKLGP
jgi:hypothetical protein